jgi:pyruvate formate lyase activating enzyme
MVTNGYVTPEGLDLFAECVDVWRVDIKGFSEESYKRLCHVRHAEAVRAAAERAAGVHGMHVECVTNIVPGINDSDDELRAIAQWISTRLGPLTPWHVTRFTPYLDFADVAPTPLTTLERARAIGREAGLAFIYLGNVLTSDGEDTICPECGVTAVSRQGFSATVRNVTEQGACGSCGASLNMRMRPRRQRVD